MENLDSLVPALRSANPTAAMAVLQNWCNTTPFVRIRASLLALAPAPRAIVAQPVRDILAHYPRTVWGVPMLIYGTAGQGVLPMAAVPGTELVALRQVLAGPDSPAGNTILAGRVQAALLRFESDSVEAPSLPSDWVSQVLPAAGSVQLAGGQAFPWPEAVEATILMNACVQAPRELEPAGASVFLPDHGWGYAKETARMFRQSLVAKAGQG